MRYTLTIPCSKVFAPTGKIPYRVSLGGSFILNVPFKTNELKNNNNNLGGLMNFASMRIQKVDQGTETAAHNHNLRASSTKEEKNINRTLTCNNELLLGRADTVKAINEKIESLNLKTAVRKDANRAIEFVLSASPEHFYNFSKAGITREDWDNITIEKLGEEEYWKRLSEIKKFAKTENIKKWKQDIVNWINSDPDLKNNVINLVLHADEKNIHAHLICTPVLNGKLTAKQFFTPGCARHWQDTYARSTGLRRGISSEEKHKTATEYDVQQAMKKGYEQGYKQGIADTKKTGVKLGAIVDGVKSSWHKPSSKAIADANKLSEQAKIYANKIKKQAEKIVQDERKKRISAEQKSAKAEADHEATKRELARVLDVGGDELRQKLTAGKAKTFTHTEAQLKNFFKQPQERKQVPEELAPQEALAKNAKNAVGNKAKL